MEKICKGFGTFLTMEVGICPANLTLVFLRVQVLIKRLLTFSRNVAVFAVKLASLLP